MIKKFCSLILISIFIFSLIPLTFAIPNNDFEYYLPFQIDKEYINEDLENFNLLIHFSNSSGLNAFNASKIFEVLENNYNGTAFIDRFGNNLYYEIDFWNYTLNEAYIWVKIPILYSNYDNLFYFLFDAQKDNSFYINQFSTWDEKYKFVYHMNDLTNMTIYDSTINNNTLNKNDVNKPYQSHAFLNVIGNHQVFSTSAGELYNNSPNNLPLNSSDSFTLSFWLYPNYVTLDDDFGYIYFSTLNSAGYSRGVIEFSDNIYFHGWSSGDFSTGTDYSTFAWQYLTFSWNTTHMTVYKNLTNLGSSAVTLQDASSFGNITIFNAQFSFLDEPRGLMDELTLINESINFNQLNATFINHNDELVNYYVIENNPAFFNGALAFIAFIIALVAVALIFAFKS